LLDHTCAQIGIDQTAFGSVDCIVKHSSRNLFFFREAREPRTFKDIHFRLPDFLSEYHTRCYQNQGRLKKCTVAPWAPQHAVEDLPAETIVYLLGSRYCETDRLSDIAWSLFGNGPTGWRRVQAICDYVHNHIIFGYQFARPTKTAWEAFNEGNGVCRDFAHLGIALCRCLNIPARYCTGYLGDIGVPPVDAPMDFAGWFEAYLGGRWYTFDPRNNTPRIGRVLIGQGRDAADVPITHTFGPNTLVSFKVITDEIA